MIGTLIWLVGVVCTIWCVLDIFKKNISTAGKVIASVLVFLLLATVMITMQNFVGVGFAQLFGLDDPRLGLCMGSIPLVGGHGTAGSFGPQFEDAGVMGASVVAVSCATYGLVSGVLYRRLPKNLVGIYTALIGAMVCGRVVWGIVTALLLLNGEGFTLAAFIAGAFTNAIPGIILQLVAIPVVVLALQKAKLIAQPA